MKKKIVSCLLVAVMCTLIGSVAYADESGSMYRADNIKSHGTLLCEQPDADDEVYITTQDMIYLADEMDFLEDMIDALNMKSNPNIEYTYHEHTDNCPSHIEYGYRRWSRGPDNFGDGGREAWFSLDSCSLCGYYSPQSRWEDYYADLPPVLHCSRLVYTCGWREGEIEKAEIKFSPN